MNNPQKKIEDFHFDKTEYTGFLNELCEERCHQMKEGRGPIRIPTEMYQRCVQGIFDVAKKQKDTCGKWMLFEKPKVIDSVWAKIAEATVDGKLGCAAKVSPSSFNQSTHLICVYTRDFTNKQEVLQLLQGIHALGLRTSGGFKPDVFTRLDIYKKNEWGLRPTIYHDMTSK